MSRAPVTEPGLGLLPAGALAATATALLSAGIIYWYTGQTAIGGFISLFAFALMVAFALGGFAAPAVARYVVGKDPLSWSGSVLTGVLAGLIPFALVLLVKLVVGLIGASMEDENFAIGDWPAGLVMVAICGAAGGLIFRALYGARPVARK